MTDEKELLGRQR